MGDIEMSHYDETVGEVMELAAKTLPELWEIIVVIEKGSFSVQLWNGFEQIKYPSNRETILESFKNALKYAVDHRDD